MSTHLRRCARSLATLLSACAALCGTAGAADTDEFWPEVSACVRLNPATRIYLDANHAKGKESDARSFDLSAYLDVSLKPILRKSLRTTDWQSSRYFWLRIGYTRLEKVSGGTRSAPEDRAVVSAFGKLGLPLDVWIEGRVRADLRWIGGEDSTRYRARIEATREFTVGGHAVVPYVDMEWFYDTRYDGWSRTLLQVGPEVTVSPHLRFEVYYARQVDTLPDSSSLDAIGVVAKAYF